MKTYLFTDNTVWHDAIGANNLRQALRFARASHGIGGRIVRVRVNGASVAWRVVGTTYEFELREA